MGVGLPFPKAKVTVLINEYDWLDTVGPKNKDLPTATT